jgi:hypothetical protein
MSFKSEIDERDKLIQYLREEYVKATGQDLKLPYKFERYAGQTLAQAETTTIFTPEEDFQSAVSSLELPKPNQNKSAKFSYGKKEKLVLSRKAEGLEVISLCDFENKVPNISEIQQRNS